MPKKIILWVISILFISSLNIDALDLLSLAQTHDNLGWKLTWVKGDHLNAQLCFSKAINYYKEYIDRKGISIADIETRRFTALDAQKRIVYIYKFGLRNQLQAKKEFQKLLGMFALVKAKFNIGKITLRVKSKVAQLKAEFKYRGYVVHLDKNYLWCLFLDECSAEELIIYQDLIPIARAQIREIKKLNVKEFMVKAQVFSQNPKIKLKVFSNAEPTPAVTRRDEKKSSIAEGYYQSGKELFEKRDFGEAQEYFYSALRYNPDYKEALNMSGLIYFYYQNLTKAEKFYIQALEIDPTYLEAFINLAGVYLSSGDFPIDTNIALDMLAASLATSKSYVRVYYWFGHALDDFMFFDLAKKYYLQAEGITPVFTVDKWYKELSLKKKLNSQGQTYWDTANIYLDTPEPMLNSSIYVFDELLKLNPNDVQVKKRLDDILKVCPFARDSSLYKEVILHRNRGFELKKENRLKEAIDEIRTSLYLDQIISSEFRRCIRRIPRIKID